MITSNESGEILKYLVSTLYREVFQTVGLDLDHVCILCNVIFLCGELCLITDIKSDLK
jgi:hypothetical protein